MYTGKKSKDPLVNPAEEMKDFKAAGRNSVQINNVQGYFNYKGLNEGKNEKINNHNSMRHDSNQPMFLN